MVNEVRDLARQYGQVEQFRCRVADLLGKYIHVEHNSKGMPEQAEAQAVVVPEPTCDEWRSIAENARSADMVDFLAGAAAYGLWLRGKIPNSIPSGRVLGEGMVQVDLAELEALREFHDAYTEDGDYDLDEFLQKMNSFSGKITALRANQGGAAT